MLRGGCDLHREGKRPAVGRDNGNAGRREPRDARRRGSGSRRALAGRAGRGEQSGGSEGREGSAHGTVAYPPRTLRANRRANIGELPCLRSGRAAIERGCHGAYGGGVERLPAQRGTARSAFAAKLRSPVYVLPGAVVAAVLAAAIAWQPGSPSAGGGVQVAAVPAAETPPPSATLPASAASPTPRERVAPSPTPSRAAGEDTPTAEVAGARSTAAPAQPRVFANVGDCGALREAVYPVAVEQGLQGVTIAVRSAAVYPLEYLQCVLAGMQGAEAEALAGMLAERYRAGDTHAVLLDLWVTNGARTFAQVNLRRASVAAAGQLFSPSAVIGGRAEAVLNSGEGRSLSMLVTLRNTLGEATGPLTLTVEAPLVGGQPVAGRYQLFIPLP